MAQSTRFSITSAAGLIGAALLVTSTSVAAQWSYKVERDPMSDRPSVAASTRSINAHRFAFPYQGGTRATLMVRDHPQLGRNVLVWIDRGQFACSSNCTVQMRFDDAEAYSVEATGADDGSTDVLFLRETDSLIEKLQTAKRVRLATTFFQHGQLMYEFKTAGLTWPPPAPSPKRSPR